MDRACFLYDVLLIVTSAMMAVLAADRKDIPHRWMLVYVTGVASVGWRSYRLCHTWKEKRVREDKARAEKRLRDRVEMMAANEHQKVRACRCCSVIATPVC